MRMTKSKNIQSQSTHPNQCAHVPPHGTTLAAVNTTDQHHDHATITHNNQTQAHTNLRPACPGEKVATDTNQVGCINDTPTQ